MSEQHTPVPWEVRANDNGEPELWSGDTWIAVLPHQCVKSLERLALANARFIVTACNSHEDLLMMLDEYAMRWSDGTLARLAASTDRRGEIARRNAAQEIRRRAAITKATTPHV